jgi:molybdenum-dependent DNA-binding transcriptional regulator ModE
MAKNVTWEKQIGRRLRLRDLHVFFTVIQHGSMAKAAAELGISQPSVSELIADLEHALGVRLFDRSTRGVEPTMYGDALLTRGQAAFDELRQGIRDIEFLSDPAAGEIRLGAPKQSHLDFFRRSSSACHKNIRACRLGSATSPQIHPNCAGCKTESSTWLWVLSARACRPATTQKPWYTIRFRL